MEETHDYNHTNKKRKILLEEPKNNDENNTRSKKKLVKMYCPKAAKIVEVIAWEDQRLDLGRIARIFGIEPVTLKLNGHFISRGVDLVASSVTWRSLLSYFSYKGLSTGVDHSEALVVDGKLEKCGSKRQHDPELPEVNNKMNCLQLREEGMRVNQARDPQTEVVNSTNNKKLKGNSNVCEIKNRTNRCSDTGLKRKNWLESISPLIKRARIGERCSNEFCQGHNDPEVPEVNSKINCLQLWKEGVRINQARAPQTEVISLENNKEFKGKGNSNVCEIESKTVRCSATGLKRKIWLENISPLIKRARIGKRCSNELCQGMEEREGCVTK